jgi:small subunit ribosomal protein S6
MNTYDLTVILDGKTTAAKKKSAIEKIEGMVKTFEGSIGEIRDWGERELAYPIDKNDTGFYLTFPIHIQPESAKKFQDKIRLEDYVLRYLMVRSDAKVVGVKEVKKTTKKGTKSAKSE